jgi:CRISPR system Cascade subunit CasE
VFLTRMPINGRRRGARLLLSSPQAMHAAVMAGFADPSPTADGRVLWRLDSHDSGRRVLLYAASPGKPDFTHIVEQAGWPTTEAWDTRPYDGLLGSLRRGQRWQFRLTANPVHAVRLPAWPKTKPLPHVTVKQQEQWLLDRADRLGFQVAPSQAGVDELDLAVVERSLRRFERNGSGTVTISFVTYEGHLEVVDVDALRQSLTHGIGRAKAYGCGLLTLARARSAATE